MRRTTKTLCWSLFMISITVFLTWSFIEHRRYLVLSEYESFGKPGVQQFSIVNGKEADATVRSFIATNKFEPQEQKLTSHPKGVKVVPKPSEDLASQDTPKSKLNPNPKSDNGLCVTTSTPGAERQNDTSHPIQKKQDSPKRNNLLIYLDISCLNIITGDFDGELNVSMKAEKEDELERKFPEMKNGHFSPSFCIPTEKLAILIPFRDRHEHLLTLLPNLIPMLMKQGIDFTIFVIEQDLPTSFNKGLVYNAGFLEALKIDNFDCFMFHDVDLLPLSEFNYYRCNQLGPEHYMNGVDKFNYKLSYVKLVGGVLGFTKKQYTETNGFSNLYFGWGGEDDDIGRRMASAGLSVWRKTKEVGLYKMVKHTRDKRWQKNPRRVSLLKSAAQRRTEEGLNTAKYTVTSIEKKQLYIHVRIAINQAVVYKTAPDYMAEDIRKAWRADIANRIAEGTDEELNLIYNNTAI